MFGCFFSPEGDGMAVFRQVGLCKEKEGGQDPSGELPPSFLHLIDACTCAYAVAYILLSYVYIYVYYI